MKAYLIDPLQRAITQIDFAAESTSIVHLLHLNDDFCVDVFPWKDHQIFAFLQGHAENRHAFWINGYRWSLAGEALITGPSQIEPIIKRGFTSNPGCACRRARDYRRRRGLMARFCGRKPDIFPLCPHDRWPANAGPHHRRRPCRPQSGA
jgi:hypothetical protein